MTNKKEPTDWEIFKEVWCGVPWYTQLNRIATFVFFFGFFFYGMVCFVDLHMVPWAVAACQP